MSEPNNPETLARARQQLAHITDADDSTRAHIWYVQAVGWFKALHAERLIDEDTYERLMAEASKLREAHRAMA